MCFNLVTAEGGGAQKGRQVSPPPFMEQLTDESGCRRDILGIPIARLASPPTRSRRRVFGLGRFVDRDRRRENTEGDSFIALFIVGDRTVTPRPLLARRPLVAVIAIAARLAVLVAITVAVTGLLTDFFFAVFAVVTVGVAHHFVAIIIVLIVAATATALGLIFFEPRTTLFEHAEIMVRELEKIFGLDAIAGQLRVARHAFVFLKQLRGIAPLAIVACVSAAVAGHSLRTLSTAAATAAALTIIDQEVFPCRTGGPKCGRRLPVLHMEVVVPGEQAGHTANGSDRPSLARSALGSARHGHRRRGWRRRC
jgi:hypothetical protein